LVFAKHDCFLSFLSRRFVLHRLPFTDVLFEPTPLPKRSLFWPTGFLLSYPSAPPLQGSVLSAPEPPLSLFPLSRQADFFDLKSPFPVENSSAPILYCLHEEIRWIAEVPLPTHSRYPPPISSYGVFSLLTVREFCAPLPRDSSNILFSGFSLSNHLRPPSQVWSDDDLPFELFLSRFY